MQIGRMKEDPVISAKKFLKFFFVLRVTLFSKIVYLDELNLVFEAAACKTPEIRNRNSSSAWTLRCVKPQHLRIQKLERLALEELEDISHRPFESLLQDFHCRIAAMRKKDGVVEV